MSSAIVLIPLSRVTTFATFLAPSLAVEAAPYRSRTRAASHSTGSSNWPYAPSHFSFRNFQREAIAQRLLNLRTERGPPPRNLRTEIATVSRSLYLRVQGCVSPGWWRIRYLRGGAIAINYANGRDTAGNLFNCQRRKVARTRSAVSPTMSRAGVRSREERARVSASFTSVVSQRWSGSKLGKWGRKVS